MRLAREVAAALVLLLAPAVSQAQSVTTRMEPPRARTVRVIEVERRAEDRWDRYWADRVAFELADAEFELEVLRTRRPVDRDDAARLQAMIRDVSRDISRLRALHGTAQNAIRRDLVVVHGWDGIARERLSAIVDRAHVDAALRLAAGDLVDLTVQEVQRTFPDPYPPRTGVGAGKKFSTQQHVRMLRRRDAAPPDFQEPQQGGLSPPLRPLDPAEVRLQVGAHVSRRGRPVVAVRDASPILVFPAVVRFRAVLVAADGRAEIELSPPEGLLMSRLVPGVPTIAALASGAAYRVVDWPADRIEEIRLEVIEAWSDR